MLREEDALLFRGAMNALPHEKKDPAVTATVLNFIVHTRFDGESDSSFSIGRNKECVYPVDGYEREK